MWDLGLLNRSEINTIMLKFDEFRYEDEEVLCRCGLRASRRISRTEKNPGRRFFDCRAYKSPLEQGCGYFLWYDTKIAAGKDRKQLVDIVDKLRLQVADLQLENAELHRVLDGFRDYQVCDESGSSNGGRCVSSNKEIEFTDMQVELQSINRRLSKLERGDA